MGFAWSRDFGEMLSLADGRGKEKPPSGGEPRKHSEIDYLNGLIVRRGEALGIAIPTNRVLVALVKLTESKAC